MRVLLLKEEPDDPSDDPYRAAFAALGLELGLELDVDYLPLQHCEYDDSAAAAVLSTALLQLPTSAGGAAAADESTQPAAAEAPVASVACESVVVTAPRACTALTRALPLLEPEPELRWRAVKRAYVVGPRTAALLEAGLPHLEIIPPGGAPKAADLLEIVSAAVTAELQGSGAAADAAAAPLLRVHSTDRADSLAPKLRRLVAADPPAAGVGVGVGGLGVHQAAIYGMRPVPIEELTASLQQMGLMLPPPLPPPPPPPDGEEEAASAVAVGAAAVAECCCVVCFSPLRLAELAQISSHNHTVHGDGGGDAGAAGAAGVGGGAGMASLSSSSAMGPSSSSSSSTSWMSDEKVVKLIAMGPTTSAALQSLGLPCAATAATPSPKGVADAVAAASAVGASASGDESQPADAGGGGGGGSVR